MTTAQIFALLFAALPACPTEDSANCAWDAARSNGRGLSFVAISISPDAALLIYADGTTAVFE